MTRFVQEIGATVLFAAELGELFLRRGVRWRHVVDQMYAVGVRSLTTTLSTGLFVGAIMAIQINIQLKDFGAQGFLGGLATSVTIRNVGPVLIAFLLSGKVGAYTSAELGTMKITDQIDAIRCLGTNPIQYIILPRMVAIVLSSFLLLIVGLLVTIAGGVAFSDLTLGVNALNYIHNIPRLVSWWSVGVGVTKSFVFGLLIGIICCYQGYTTTGGTTGVGVTVKRTAVTTLVCIVIADFSLSILSSFIQDLLGEGLNR
jgi:phospholipid/cholesterol/gamma-HCH transport system permease protein